MSRIGNELGFIPPPLAGEGGERSEPGGGLRRRKFTPTRPLTRPPSPFGEGFMNLAEIALRPGRAAAAAARPAFLTAAGPVTNAEFQDSVHAIAHALVALGVTPGSKVLLRMTNSVEFAASFLALVPARRRAGAAEFAVRPQRA